MKASLALKRLVFRVNRCLGGYSGLVLKATQVLSRILNLGDENCRGCYGMFCCVGDFYCKSWLEWCGLPCEKPTRKYRTPLKLSAAVNSEWPLDLLP